MLRFLNICHFLSSRYTREAILNYLFIKSQLLPLADEDGDGLLTVEQCLPSWGISYIQVALLRKRREAWRSPFPRRTYPTGLVTGMPSAV